MSTIASKYIGTSFNKNGLSSFFDYFTEVSDQTYLNATTK